MKNINVRKRNKPYDGLFHREIASKMINQIESLANEF